MKTYFLLYEANKKNDFSTKGMELTHILVVNNINLSKKFYINVLGADLYREYDGTSCVVKFLNNWILLVTGGKPTEDKPNTTFKAPNNPKEISHSFTIRVPDCKSAYETLKSRGAKFKTPPKDWGSEIRAFFSDPDGHLFEISEYVPDK